MRNRESVWEEGADAYAAAAAASPLPDRLLAALAGERIADLGCGTGVAADALRRRCGQLTQVDITEGLLARAPEGEGLRRCRADLARLPFQDQAFDGLHSFLVWSVLSEPDTASAWREAARVLRPGGRFVLGLANSRSFYSPLRAFAEACGFYSLGHCRHANPSDVALEAGLYGFRVIEIIALAKPVTGSTAWTRAGASIAARLDRAFAKMLPWWGGDLVVLLERNP